MLKTITVILVVLLIGLFSLGCEARPKYRIAPTDSTYKNSPISSVSVRGNYVSDRYLGSRSLSFQGSTLTMYVQAISYDMPQASPRFPQLGSHTYSYSIDNSIINLTDVVSGESFSISFRYLGEYGKVVLGGDSYSKR